MFEDLWVKGFIEIFQWDGVLHRGQTSMRTPYGHKPLDTKFGFVTCLVPEKFEFWDVLSDYHTLSYLCGAITKFQSAYRMLILWRQRFDNSKLKTLFFNKLINRINFMIISVWHIAWYDSYGYMCTPKRQCFRRSWVIIGWEPTWVQSVHTYS